MLSYSCLKVSALPFSCLPISFIQNFTGFEFSDDIARKSARYASGLIKHAAGTQTIRSLGRKRPLV